MNRSHEFLLRLVASASIVLACGELHSRTPVATADVNASEFSSLQQAIDALPEGGGIVRLPPGTFRLEEPLIIARENLLLTGAGSSTHIVNGNQSGKPAILVRHKDWTPNDRNTSLWRIQFSNFRLTGNEKSGHGIEAHFINEIFVDNLTVSNHGGDGIHLDHCIEDPRVNDSLITYNAGAGVHAVGCHDLVVGTNQFEENRDALRFEDGFNLCATGNNIDDHLRHGIVIENSMGNSVSGNMIEECVGTGLVIDRDVYATTVASNIFIHDRGGGVDALDLHGSTISANTFAAIPKRALAIGSGSSRLTVTGNTFADSYIGNGKTKRTPQTNASSGIVLNDTSLHTITGNTFSNLATKALELEGEPSKYIIFSQNLVVGVGTDARKLIDSRVEGNLVVPKEEVCEQ